MAKGSSQSQASSSAQPSRPGKIGPRGTPAASAGMRRRKTAGGGGSEGGFAGSGSGNMLRFYTDEAPGLKMSPTAVLTMSLLFITFVTCLHVFGKLYLYQSAPSAGS
ncbi:preprotein translocase Sec, Sec61-beta subunit protein [Wolffia australiana]